MPETTSQKSFYVALITPSSDENTKGKALVFRRRTMEAYFDLLCEFDESFIKSSADSYDAKFLVQNLTSNTSAFWITEYTEKYENFQKRIDTEKYDIILSWET